MFLNHLHSTYLHLPEMAKSACIIEEWLDVTKTNSGVRQQSVINVKSVNVDGQRGQQNEKRTNGCTHRRTNGCTACTHRRTKPFQADVSLKTCSEARQLSADYDKIVFWTEKTG